MTATTYVAVSGSIRTGFTHYGPFTSVDQAQAWLSHPHRTEETRGATVVPLFGGIGITDEPVSVREWVARNYSDESKRLVAEGAEALPEDQAKFAAWTGVARP